MEIPGWYIALSMLMFGLAFGSFANVVIWRLPRGESLSHPASRCPSCDSPIRWHDNVPVVGWLILRGRCRDCGESISPRYPMVEAACGALWLMAAIRFGLDPRTVTAAVLFWYLLVLSAIDLDSFRLPNVLTLWLYIIGALLAITSQLSGLLIAPFTLAPAGALSHPAVSSALGVLLGVLPLWLLAEFYTRIRGLEGLGMGDVKLLAGLGAFLGPQVLLVLMFASFLGGAWGGFTVVRGARDMTSRIPFGPFLSLAAVVTVLFGDAMLDAYLRLIGLR